MDNFPKTSQCFVRETYRREPSSSSYILVSRSLEDGTWSLWGVSWCLSPLWQFKVLTWCGISLTGAWGLILAVVEGERQICHIFVVCAAMLVEHSQPIKGLARFYHDFSRPLTSHQSSGLKSSLWAVWAEQGATYRVTQQCFPGGNRPETPPETLRRGALNFLG